MLRLRPLLRHRIEDLLQVAVAWGHRSTAWAPLRCCRVSVQSPPSPIASSARRAGWPGLPEHGKRSCQTVGHVHSSPRFAGVPTVQLIIIHDRSNLSACMKARQIGTKSSTMGFRRAFKESHRLDNSSRLRLLLECCLATSVCLCHMRRAAAIR